MTRRDEITTQVEQHEILNARRHINMTGERRDINSATGRIDNFTN